jgi:hypothetical protein
LGSTRKGSRWMKFRQNYRVRLLPHGLWPIAPWPRLI